MQPRMTSRVGVGYAYSPVVCFLLFVINGSCGTLMNVPVGTCDIEMVKSSSSKQPIDFMINNLKKSDFSETEFVFHRMISLIELQITLNNSHPN